MTLLSCTLATIKGRSIADNIVTSEYFGYIPREFLSNRFNVRFCRFAVDTSGSTRQVVVSGLLTENIFYTQREDGAIWKYQPDEKGQVHFKPILEDENSTVAQVAISNGPVPKGGRLDWISIPQFGEIVGLANDGEINWVRSIPISGASSESSSDSPLDVLTQ